MESYELDAAAREVEKQLSQQCENFTTTTNVERRLVLKIRALEKTQCCLKKPNKDQKNELEESRRMLTLAVKDIL